MTFGHARGQDRPGAAQRLGRFDFLGERAVWLAGYLTDVLRRIAAIDPMDTAALEALLPDRWVAAHPEHRLEQREEESREAQARRRRKRAARRVAAAS